MVERDSSLGAVFGAIEPTRSTRRLAVLNGRLRARLLDEATPPPSRLGRFELLEPLGRGGMSTVYLAVDPTLDRKVAIKLLRVAGASARGVLVGEARALAALMHPNIVEVFDVGVQDRDPPTVFIAMEFVPGLDLAHWLRTVPPWRAALQSFIEAGRGLAAAHERGVIHGDFKPANVLRRNDGSIKVIDFGLARMMNALDRTEGDAPGAVAHAGARGGGGTLGYCAPEKLRGAADSIASDVFSFAASTWEALAGRHPFAARTRDTFLDQVASGPAAAMPREVPRELARILVRGLDEDPRRRWPAMPPLLAALERVLEGYPRRRVWIGGGLALTLSVTTAWALQSETPAEPNCEAIANADRGAWLDQPREDVRRRFEGAPAGFVRDGGDKVVAVLDAYVEALADARLQTCEARLRGELPGPLAEARSTCLDERRDTLQRFVGSLSVPERLPGSIAGSYHLPRVAPCLSPETDASPSTPPDSIRGEVEDIMQANRELRDTLDAGEFDRGLARAKELVAAAEALGYEPARVSSLNSLGAFLHAKGDLEGAKSSYEAAYFGAQRNQMDVLTLQIATNLVNAHESLGRYDQALAWARHARAVVHRAPDPIVVSKLDYAESLVLQALGRDDEALQLLEAIVQTRRTILGPRHPTTANAVFELGNVHMAKGNHERAIALFEESLVGHEAALGPNHPGLANTYNNMGNVLSYLGRDDAAAQSWQRALQIREDSLGPNHIALGGTLTNLAAAANGRGDTGVALDYARRAVAIREAGLGADHPSLIGTLHELGEAHLAQGRPDLARRCFERAIDIGDTAFGGMHPQMMRPLAGAARAAWAMGDLDATIRHATRLVEREQPPLPDPHHAAEALWVMAQAQWARGEHEESRRMAEYAITAYGDAGEQDAAQTVAAWMEARDA